MRRNGLIRYLEHQARPGAYLEFEGSHSHVYAPLQPANHTQRRVILQTNRIRRDRRSLEFAYYFPESVSNEYKSLANGLAGSYTSKVRTSHDTRQNGEYLKTKLPLEFVRIWELIDSRSHQRTVP